MLIIMNKQERENGIKDMLEDIANKLASLYKKEGVISLNNSERIITTSYISLDKSDTKKVLWWYAQKKSRKLIFAVDARFSESPNGENNLGVFVDEGLPIEQYDIITEGLRSYVTEFAPINVFERKFKYIMDKPSPL